MADRLEIAALIVKALNLSINKQSETQSKGTNYEKIAPFMAAIIGSVVDLAIDAAASGRPLTNAQITAFLITRAAAFAGLSDIEQIVCLGAVVELVTSVAIDGSTLVGAIGAEAGTGGVATPLVAPVAVVSAAAMILAAFKVNQQCGPLVMKGWSKINQDAFSVFLEANRAIGYPPR